MIRCRSTRHAHLSFQRSLALRCSCNSPSSLCSPQTGRTRCSSCANQEVTAHPLEDCCSTSAPSRRARGRQHYSVIHARQDDARCSLERESQLRYSVKHNAMWPQMSPTMPESIASSHRQLFPRALRQTARPTQANQKSARSNSL